MYTSGSTGRPKGVMSPSEGLWSRLMWMAEQYDVGAADVLLHKTPMGFDVSMWELTLSFLTGGRLLVMAPGGHQDPAEVSRELGRGVTVAPTHYVLFHRKHLTGFTRCRDLCLETFHRAVSERYPAVLGTGLYTVFDLTRPRQAPSSPGRLS